MGRPWSAVLELGLGHADPVPSLGASPKGKMVRWISEGVYSVGLLGAKTKFRFQRCWECSGRRGGHQEPGRRPADESLLAHPHTRLGQRSQARSLALWRNARQLVGSLSSGGACQFLRASEHGFPTNVFENPIDCHRWGGCEQTVGSALDEKSSHRVAYGRDRCTMLGCRGQNGSSGYFPHHTILSGNASGR